MDKIPRISIEINFEIPTLLVKKVTDDLYSLGFECNTYRIYETEKRQNLTFGKTEDIETYYLEEAFDQFFHNMTEEQMLYIEKLSKRKDIITSIGVCADHYDDDFPALVIPIDVIKKIARWNASIDIDMY